MIQQHPSYLPPNQTICHIPSRQVKETHSPRPQVRWEEKDHSLHKLKVRPLGLVRTKCSGERKWSGGQRYRGDKDSSGQ